MLKKNYRFKMKYTYIIGIDAGTKTGVAVWDKNKKEFEVITTLKIHQAMYLIKVWKDNIWKEKVFIRVEDARKRRWIPQEKNLKERVGRAKGAGSVCRDASIWEDFLTDIGADFEMVAPRKGMTKYSAEAFKKLTGYKGVTSEHGRDAGMLVYGY